MYTSPLFVLCSQPADHQANRIQGLVPMETQPISSFQFPPGVRFYPSDEELIVYYLHNKVNSRPLPAAVVGEIELYSYNPWDLPKKALFGEEEWYFFSPRDRKYPNGARPNRTAASGYWKATGTDKPILSCSGARIGVKKALVFYIGKPPNGVKTDWIMIEYRLPDTHKRPSRSKGSMRLDDWVLCRIRQKGNMSKNSWEVPHSPIKVTEDTPNLKELHSVYAAKNALDICSSYFLSKDCHLLAKLLATQDLPRIETNTRATSCSSNISQNCKTVVYEHGTIKENQVTNSFFPSSLNQQGKPIEEIGYGNIPPSEKAMTNLNKNEFFLAGNVNGASFYNQQQSHGDMFKLNLSSAMMTLQELDVSAFAAKFLP